MAIKVIIFFKFKVRRIKFLSDLSNRLINFFKNIIVQIHAYINFLKINKKGNSQRNQQIYASVNPSTGGAAGMLGRKRGQNSGNNQMAGHALSGNYQAGNMGYGNAYQGGAGMGGMGGAGQGAGMMGSGMNHGMNQGGYGGQYNNGMSHGMGGGQGAGMMGSGMNHGMNQGGYGGQYNNGMNHGGSGGGYGSGNPLMDRLSKKMGGARPGNGFMDPTMQRFSGNGGGQSMPFGGAAGYQG